MEATVIVWFAQFAAHRAGNVLETIWGSNKILGMFDTTPQNSSKATQVGLTNI